MVFSRRGPPRADHHVGQSKERVKLMPVLRQPAIPHFPMPKYILHDVEGMFHERTDARRPGTVPSKICNRQQTTKHAQYNSMSGILSKVAKEALSFIKNADKEVSKKMAALKAERERIANALMEIDDAMASVLTGGLRKKGVLRHIDARRSTVRRMSAAAKAKISKAAKARWAKVKAAGKTKL